MGDNTKCFLRTLSLGPRASTNSGDVAIGSSGSPMAKKSTVSPYKRLARSISDCGGSEQVPKGYVPVLVVNEVAEERVLVHVSVLKEPMMSPLLEMAAREFGYNQKGILRIPCGSEQFRSMVGELAKASDREIIRYT